MNAQLDSIRRLLAGRAPARRANDDKPVLVVASGKGGVGTSCIAALLALRAAGAGHRTLLVDAVDGIGTLGLLLGAEPGPGLGALRGGAADVEALMTDVVPGLTLLDAAAGADESEAAALSAAERRILYRRVVAAYAAFDLVIVDAGSRLDGVLAAVGSGARALLAVATPDRVTLAATHALIKVLTGRAGHTPVHVVLNRCDEAEGSAAFDALRAGVRRFLGRVVGFAGAVPDDARLHEAAAAGELLSVTGAAGGAGPAGAPAAAGAADAVGTIDLWGMLEGWTGPRLVREPMTPNVGG